MARRLLRARTAMLAVCAVLAAAAVTTTIFHAKTKQQNSSEQQILRIAPEILQWRLFSGAVDASGNALVTADRAVEKWTADSKGIDSRFQTNKDKSTVDERMQPDGVHAATSDSYYSPTNGEEVRHPLASTSYKGVDVLVAQDRHRRDGSLEQKTRVTAGGAKSVIDYAEDSVTVTGETLYDPPPPCCGEGPVLKSEMHWLADANHTLVYSDLTDASGKRTKSKFDPLDHSVYWTMVCPEKDCNRSGVVLTEYYPHTSIVRVQSVSTWEVDDVKYFFQTGKLWFDDKIMSSSNDVTYYDADGLKPVLEQNLFRHDEIGPDKATKMTADSVYEPFMITEFNALGEQKNVFWFQNGKLDNIDAIDITIGGIFYRMVTVYIHPETGEFSWGALFTGDASTRVDVRPENWKMPPLPRPKSDELKRIAPFIDAELWVPPPRSSGVP